jgi:hypothetical protein
VFDRVLFQTHGGGGRITFSDDDATNNASSIFDWTWLDFKDRQYHKLFPVYTRIYFDGCSVAAGDDDGRDPQKGEKFLTNAGSVLLRLHGGETFAWTNPGYSFPWAFWASGHTYHFNTGKLVKFRFGPGGVRLANPPNAPEPIRIHDTSDD